MGRTVAVIRQAVFKPVNLDKFAPQYEPLLVAARQQQYQAAAFESGALFVYTASNLSKQEKLRILQAVASQIEPALQRFSA